METFQVTIGSHGPCCAHRCDACCQCCCHHRDGKVEKLPRLALTGIDPPLPDYMLDEYKQEQFLKLYPAHGCHPSIATFSPRSAYPGSLVVILGHNFAPRREDNKVMVGTRRAIVVTAECHRLVVISNSLTRTGSVQVTTSRGTAKGPTNFTVTSWPLEPGLIDEPPFSFEGVGNGAFQTPRSKLLTQSDVAGGSTDEVRVQDIPPTGNAKVLAIYVYPKDHPPANATTSRQDVIKLGAAVTKYYQQASYSKLNVTFDVTPAFQLVDNQSRYFSATAPNGTDPGYPNFINLNQIICEAANAARTASPSYNLDSYDVLFVVVHLSAGTFARAWGGRTVGPNFNYFDDQSYNPPLSINFTISKSLGSATIQDTSDWGRVAHELAHNLVGPASTDPSFINAEDLYGSDLPPGADTSAIQFDLMGDHDSHPLFSAYNINSLGWYSASNVKVLNWDTTPHSFDIDIVAHGLTQNTNPNRVHLVKVYLGTGLEYWVEVRQRPGTTGQVFDDHIPTQGALDGGVIISRAVRSTQNNNQAMRAITLLQSNQVCLKTDDVAVDPARALLFTVLNDNIQSQPRVCRVRIEWAQPTQPTPNGPIDLSITPWDTATWSTPDIWIDRDPFGTYDRVDTSGNPTIGGDDPRVGEKNLIKARIRNSGTQAANNVQATFYVVTPPGVGDNGSWTPLTTVTVPSLVANSNTTIEANWVPVLDKHTCLQVRIVPQTGESLLSNNMAQENVFHFLPASHSVPEPVELQFAVRNPLNRINSVSLALSNVPEGFYVYTPHRSVVVGPLGERTVELLVVPLRVIPELKTKEANVRVAGWLPHGYTAAVGGQKTQQSSVYLPIGGLRASVSPRVGSQIQLDDPPKVETGRGGRVTVEVRGFVTPRTGKQKVRVDLRTVEGDVGQSIPATTDEAGRFAARFVLGGSDKPSVSRKTTVDLAFQAHIINASVLAPADSNVVHYRYVVDDGPSIPK